MTDSRPICEQYQTPSNVVSYMKSLIPEGVKTVLEPTPGMGNIVKALESDYDVCAPKDFFLLDPEMRFDCVVMNPPFSAPSAILENAPEEFKVKGMRVGYQFLVSCMEKSDRVIALMPWFTISDSDVRLRYLKSYGLRSVTALPRRTFRYARIQTCILELHKGWDGDTKFEVFEFLEQLKMHHSV